MASLSLGYASSLDNTDDMWSFGLGKPCPFIPGTHGSMTYWIPSDLTRTQSDDLDTQLLGGIRYIDISCRYTKNNLMVYKGLVDTSYSFKDVLRTMFNFLDDHPREVLILRIQKSGILDDSKKFLDFVERHFDPDSEMGDHVAKRIYFKNSGDISIPTIGEARGKVLILQDFKSSQPALYGMPWNSDTVSSYSHRLAPGSPFLDLKWAGIRSHFSQSCSEDFNKLRITHTTADVGVKPLDIAANNYGINGRLGRYLLYEQGNCFGIIVMDFPGNFLVGHIVKLNNQYRDPEPSDFPSHDDRLSMPDELAI
ncbi:1-phosphatidylinositol phosphodiesterase [Ceratocystis lukuohia]|uniref:1-phosphatidylinositol phosphodiesterase n=1 Tax=Ceratocystis lukuohia TaxID=2019550 RepID=A0ABR4MA64_9PEZI